jgi:GT2 family glycosyltransferase
MGKLDEALVLNLDHSGHLADSGRNGQVVNTTVRGPRVSVVIPAYGRPASLSVALEALCAQTLPRSEFEVIVSDDGSTEPLAPTVAPFSQRIAVRVVRGPNAGPAAARNRGARHARAAILAFIDDDCIPAPDWLERIVARARRSPGHLIGGAMMNTLVHDRYARATQLVMSGVYEYYRRFSTGQRFFSTTNLSAPADRFWVIGGFAEEFGHVAGEDYDFCSRWQLAGFPSVSAPETIVGHAHGHTFGSFWRQHFGYGRGLLRVRQLAARRRGKRGVQLEAPTFYAELLTYPLRDRSSSAPRRLANVGLVLLSQVATVAGAARELLFGAEIEPREWEESRMSPAGRLPQVVAAEHSKRRPSRTLLTDPSAKSAAAHRSTLTQQMDRGATDAG